MLNWFLVVRKDERKFLPVNGGALSFTAKGLWRPRRAALLV
jgi:hypothetical protein